MKTVKIIAPVRFFYNGKMHHMNDEFEYNGDMKDFMQIVSAASKRAAQAQQTKQVEEVPAQNFEKIEEGVEIITTIDDAIAASPGAIKAMIAKAEAREAIDQPESMSEPVVESDAAPNFELLEVGRGWYEITDENGNTVSAKKMRKAEAEEALATLQS